MEAAISASSPCSEVAIQVIGATDGLKNGVLKTKTWYAGNGVKLEIVKLYHKIDTASPLAIHFELRCARNKRGARRWSCRSDTITSQ